MANIYFLQCFNRWGYSCHRSIHQTKRAAKDRAELLIENEQAHSFKITKESYSQWLQTQLDNIGWRVDIDFQHGRVVAELERYTSGGIDYILQVEPLSLDAYIQAVEAIDPSEETVNYWQHDPAFRANYGDLGTAFADLDEFKNELQEEIEELKQADQRRMEHISVNG